MNLRYLNTLSNMKTKRNKGGGQWGNTYRRVHNEGHGKRRTPEFISWCGMKQRCYNPNATDYESYGGRGIKVCSTWLQINGQGYLAFLKALGRKPNKTYSLDRINVNGNYEPNNCKWATNLQQRHNRRDKCN